MNSRMGVWVQLSGSRAHTDAIICRTYPGFNRAASNANYPSARIMRGSKFHLVFQKLFLNHSSERQGR